MLLGEDEREGTAQTCSMERECHTFPFLLCVTHVTQHICEMGKKYVNAGSRHMKEEPVIECSICLISLYDRNTQLLIFLCRCVVGHEKPLVHCVWVSANSLGYFLWLCF